VCARLQIRVEGCGVGRYKCAAPKVVVSAKISDISALASCGLQSRVSSVPGRFFFICTGGGCRRRAHLRPRPFPGNSRRFADSCRRDLPSMTEISSSKPENDFFGGFADHDAKDVGLAFEIGGAAP